jgi:hypothetical protein
MFFLGCLVGGLLQQYVVRLQKRYVTNTCVEVAGT